MKKALVSIVAALAFSSTAFAGGNYKVEAKTPTDAKKGTASVVRIHIEGTNGFSLNTEYPMKLDIVAPAGVKVDKTTLTRVDAAKFTATGGDFDIKFTSSDAGKKAFTGEIKFAVYKDKDMAPVAEKLSFSFDVK